MTEWYV